MKLEPGYFSEKISINWIMFRGWSFFSKSSWTNFEGVETFEKISKITFLSVNSKIWVTIVYKSDD